MLLATVTDLGAVLVPSASAASVTPAAHGDRTHAAPPKTVVMDGHRVQRTRARLERGDPALREAPEALTAKADGRLGHGPWTVVDKPKPAPGGDVHDYLSQAPYGWPSRPRTEENPWGCPYVQRDGERNPEVDTGTDRPDIGKVVNSVTTLALAWYYTGSEPYAEHASDILRTWFVDSATRMNPNLDHGQFIGWSREDRDGMRAWNTSYLDRPVNSDFGKQESAAGNNHGTFQDMQIAGLALAPGDRALARKVVLDARSGGSTSRSPPTALSRRS